MKKKPAKAIFLKEYELYFILIKNIILLLNTLPVVFNYGQYSKYGLDVERSHVIPLTYQRTSH